MDRYRDFICDADDSDSLQDTLTRIAACIADIEKRLDRIEEQING